MRLVLPTLMLLAISASAGAQRAVVSDPDSRQSVSLTIYNGGFAVVREVRPLGLPAGRAVERDLLTAFFADLYV